MHRVDRPWIFVVVAVLAALLMSGCAMPDATLSAPTRGALSGFSIEYDVEGAAPFFAPILWTPSGSAKLRVDVFDDGVHLDALLRPHATVRIMLSEPSRGMSPLGELWASRDTLGVIQASPTGGVPEEFGSVYHIREGREPWCFLGSGFFLRDLTAPKDVSLVSQGKETSFTLTGTGEVDGRQVFVMETHGQPTTRLWVDPSIPCPLRAEGPAYTVKATRVVEQDAISWDPTEPAAPRFSIAFEAAGPRGIPPDGELPNDLFPLREAFQVAQTDPAFRGYLSSHAGAVLVAARFADIQRDAQRNMLWSLSFSDASLDGHKITVDRRAVLGLGSGALDVIVESSPWTPEDKVDVARAPAEGRPIATLASILRLRSELTTDQSDRYDFDYELHAAIGPLVRIRIPIMETTECVAGCTGQSTRGTLSALLVTGELSSFIGPPTMWRG